jgi:subtilase family serine protease
VSRRASGQLRGPQIDACLTALSALTLVVGVALVANGSASAGTSPTDHAHGVVYCTPSTDCYTPQQFEVAYGVEPLLQHGIDGRGETVVLPELAESQLSPEVSNLRQDFAAFDRVFGLPAPVLKVVSTFAGPKDPWLAYGEEVLDAEVVHSIAPGAALTILLVKGNSLNSANQEVAASLAALRLGATLGGVISLSPAGQIGGESCVSPAQVTQLNDALQSDINHHVTVVAASGDSGAAGEPCALIDALSGSISAHFVPVKEPVLIASDSLVLSAGGTTLQASHSSGAWKGETTWGLPDGSPGTGFQSSGGGFSHLFSRPSYQNGVRGIGAMRGVPDVAADANPNTGFPIVTSSGSGNDSISVHGGTSESAPIWAGVIALADQYAKRHLGFVNSAIYRIAESSEYHRAFHDIVTGPTNTAKFHNGTVVGYRASPGWDPVTGWGSPNADVLVPLLAHDVSR